MGGYAKSGGTHKGMERGDLNITHCAHTRSRYRSACVQYAKVCVGVYYLTISKVTIQLDSLFVALAHSADFLSWVSSGLNGEAECPTVVHPTIVMSATKPAGTHTHPNKIEVPILYQNSIVHKLIGSIGKNGTSNFTNASEWAWHVEPRAWYAGKSRGIPRPLYT